MEIQTQLKNLYRHWEFHTKQNKESESVKKITKDIDLFKEITWFIGERMNIWKKKVSGEMPPYTQDPILSQYRFCNIFREFDRQTIEFHELLKPLRDDFSLWLLNMFYCRMVARTETIKKLGLLSFDTNKNHILYEKFLVLPRPRFGTPYVFPISTILKSKTPTRESFIAEYLPTVIKTVADEIQSWKKESVFSGVEKILPLFGYNLRFLWTEVLIDVAYQFPEYINLFAQFPIGPGSLPTLKKLNSKEDPSLLVTQLAKVGINSGISFNGVSIFLSAENWEGIGCEFRKYVNLKEGKGRRRLFSRSN